MWVTVIPPQEAVERVVKRDKRTTEDAQRRIAAQFTNEKRVAASHVVLSTLWDPKYTQQQVGEASLVVARDGPVG